MQYPNNIAAIRRSKGMLQKDLAKEAGMVQGRLSYYEKGSIDIYNMTIRQALKLADALGCPLQDLWGELKSKYAIYAENTAMAAIDEQIEAAERAIENQDLDGIVNNSLLR